MEKTRSYTPVSCDMIDQIEIHATKKITSHIVYLEGENLHEVTGLIKTWVTRDHVEYLIMEDKLELRLDDISSINGQAFGTSCAL